MIIQKTTPTRFELARAEPIGFQNQLLNHSDTVSDQEYIVVKWLTKMLRYLSKKYKLWGSNPRLFRDWRLKPAP
jgi:hypothetical protein